MSPRLSAVGATSQSPRSCTLSHYGPQCAIGAALPSAAIPPSALHRTCIGRLAPFCVELACSVDNRGPGPDVRRFLARSCGRGRSCTLLIACFSTHPLSSSHLLHHFSRPLPAFASLKDAASSESSTFWLFDIIQSRLFTFPAATTPGPYLAGPIKRASSSTEATGLAHSAVFRAPKAAPRCLEYPQVRVHSPRRHCSFD